MRSAVADFVELEAGKQLFTGSRKFVFQHPQFDNLLLKVCISGNRDAKKRELLLKTPDMWRYGGMLTWYEEYAEYISLLSRATKLPDFLPKYYGFCDTNLGPAMVVEKILGADGEAAKTLQQVARSGEYDDRIFGLIDIFFDRINQANCTALDLHAANVVIRGDFEKLILVDGLGDKVVIKIRKFSKRLRNHYYRDRRNKILAQFDRS